MVALAVSDAEVWEANQVVIDVAIKHEPITLHILRSRIMEISSVFRWPAAPMVSLIGSAANRSKEVEPESGGNIRGVAGFSKS